MRLPCIAIFLLAGGAGAASAAEDVPARTWAAACAACHGPEGRSEGGMPSIAGRPTQELYNLLLEFKNGKREATVMHQHARGYSDDQLRRIAAVWSRFPR